MDTRLEAPVIEPEAYLTESQVHDRWPMLKPGEMRKARRMHEIEFFAFASGPRYTAEAVQGYINHKYRRTPTTWPAGSQKQPNPIPQPTEAPSDGSSVAITSKSPIPSEVASTMPAGMSPELAQSAAEACAQRLANLRSKSLSNSSERPRRGKRTSALTLVKS